MLFIAWLLILGATFGVMATLTYQKLKVRVRRVELDDYTARLRALDRRPGRIP